MFLLARDRGGPAIAHQALLYPPTDLTRESEGAVDALIIPASETRAYRRLHLGEADPRGAGQALAELCAELAAALTPPPVTATEEAPRRPPAIEAAGHDGPLH